MRQTVVLFLSAMLLLSLVVADDDPKDLGFVERAESRLIQLDVTVHGPADVVRVLTREDFELSIGGRLIEEFTVDRICTGQAPGRDAMAVGEAEDGGAPPQSDTIQVGASLMFYFDQFHLTAEGRRLALDQARELVPQIVTGANRAMIVSSGRELRVFADLTSDTAVLFDALDRLEHDPKHQEHFADQEDFRVDEVQTQIAQAYQSWAANSASSRSNIRGAEQGALSAETNHNPFSENETKQKLGQADAKKQVASAMARAHRRAGLTLAESAARNYAREERFRTQQGLSRFSASLTRLAEQVPPKAVLYYADTMRARAGDHYLALVNRGQDHPDGAKGSMTFEQGNPVDAFEEVINEAAVHGVRLYTVLARGLTAPTGFNSAGRGTFYSAEVGNPGLASDRFQEAESSLAGFAHETGGRVFLHGVAADKIAEALADDLSCVFLLSFDPGKVVEDRRLSIWVGVNKPKVEVQTRARVFVPSAETRRTSRLQTALLDPDSIERIGLRTSVIPTGFKNGKFTALVQVLVPGQAEGAATWYLGVSLVSRDLVKQRDSGRVELALASRAPVILESEMSFTPGDFELIALAHDTTRDRVGSYQHAGSWPELDKAPAVIGPIALLQPTQGAFVRDGELTRKGPMGLEPGELVRIDLPTALIGIVCHGTSRKTVLVVERELIGETTVTFTPVGLEPHKDRCALFSDVISSDSMARGVFEYRVRVLDGDEEIGVASRVFGADDQTQEFFRTSH